MSLCYNYSVTWGLNSISFPSGVGRCTDPVLLDGIWSSGIGFGVKVCGEVFTGSGVIRGIGIGTGVGPDDCVWEFGIVICDITGRVDDVWKGFIEVPFGVRFDGGVCVGDKTAGVGTKVWNISEFVEGVWEIEETCGMIGVVEEIVIWEAGGAPTTGSSFLSISGGMKSGVNAADGDGFGTNEDYFLFGVDRVYWVCLSRITFVPTMNDWLPTPPTLKVVMEESERRWTMRIEPLKEWSLRQVRLHGSHEIPSFWTRDEIGVTWAGFSSRGDTCESTPTFLIKLAGDWLIGWSCSWIWSS